MNHAESMWGSDATCPLTAVNTTRKIPTCNGNGDGKIGDSDASGNLSNEREWFRAWQHLGNSGFLQAQFSGTPGPSGNPDALPGINVPNGSVDGTGWTVHYLLLTAADNGLWRGKFGHVLDFGMNVSGNRTIGPALTAEESLALDMKVDDGKPGTGIIRAWRTSVLPDCTTNDASPTAQIYNTALTTKACSLTFIPGF
ncbi:MAG: hypothetical protein K2Q01_02085, partial [Rickettsiales bacterium]|nr:hypothetical protein [Rickettsiales bacterium]